MKKKLIVCLLAVTIVFSGTGCGTGGQTGALSNKDWVNTDINGAVTEDLEARPQDDFGLAVNKEYLMGLKIPDGRRITGGLYSVNDEVMEKKVALLHDETITGHDADLVHEYYNMISDWETRDKLGAEPVRKYLDSIDNIKTLDDMTDFLKDKNSGGAFARLFEFDTTTSFDDPTSRVLDLYAPELSLEDSAEYRELTENGKLKKESKTAVWTSILSNLGYEEDEIKTIIDNTFQLETLLAEHILTVEEGAAPDALEKMWNPTDLEGVREATGSFPAVEILEGMGADKVNQYNLDEIDYLKSLGDIYTEENLEALKDWATIKVAEAASDYLDKKTRDEAIAANNAVKGIEGMESDDKIALSQIENTLCVPMDNMYIQKYCSEEQREAIQEIIKSVIAEYRVMLSEEDWLSEETREKAIEKLDAIKIRAVYPDKLEDWSDLEFNSTAEGGNLLDATIHIKQYLRERDLAKANEKVDKEVWDQVAMPASMVNAFYAYHDNSINILAGILNGTAYQDDFTYEQMLGGIGMIIGHEISHAFDPKGAQFDKDGEFSSWWTEEDKAAFDERAAKLIAYYDALEPVDGVQYSGTRVQGEAVADMGGMKSVLRIASGQSDFDYEQFFESYARLWAVTMIKSEAINRSKVDTHPLNYLRTNVTVQQFDEFYETYDVREGDGMYLAPEDRICVW